MKVVYRAIDGTEYDSETACRLYEQSIIAKGLVMVDCSGNIVDKPNHAALVWIRDREANEIFHALAKECDDESSANTISKWDDGVFYWDEGLEEYRWLSSEILHGLEKLRESVAARGITL